MKTLKKSLAMFLAVLCVFTAFSVAGSSADVNITMTARNADKIVFSIIGYSDYDFCCVPKGTAKTGVPDTTWAAWNTNCFSDNTEGSKKCGIEVTKSMLEAMYENGEISDEYVVYGRRLEGTNSYSYANEASAFRFAPVAPVVTAKTENTVTVKEVEGCVYKWEYYNPETKMFKNGISAPEKSEPTLDDEWQTSNVLTNIEAGKTVAVLIRYSGTAGSDIKSSFATYTVVTTLKKAPNKPATPKLVSFTKSTISVTLTEEFPVEFSIDDGKTWAGKSFKNSDGTYTSTHTFDKLQKSTMYSIIARGTVTEDQLVGESSKPALTVKTADRDKYLCDVYASTVELPGDEIKAGNTATLVAKGDAADGQPLEGDTRCVPISWIAKMGDAKLDEGTWATKDAKQTAEIKTTAAKDAKYSGTVNVTVTFQKQEYANGEWHDLTQSTNSSTFNVKKFSIFDYIFGVLNAALQLIFNGISTITNFIVGLVTK